MTVGLPGTLLRDAVDVEAYLGDTSTGPAYSDAVRHRWRVERTTRRITRPNGVEVHSTVTCWAPYPTVVAAEDRVTIDGARYEVLEVRKHRLAHRGSHLEVLCG